MYILKEKLAINLFNIYNMNSERLKIDVEWICIFFVAMYILDTVYIYEEFIFKVR